MNHLHRPALFLVAALSWSGPSLAQTLHTATVDYDSYHVPHISSSTDEGAFYALGRLQVRDMPVLTLYNLNRATGEMALRLGPGPNAASLPADPLSSLHVRDDLHVLQWRFRDDAAAQQAYLQQNDPQTYALLEAYVKGINAERKERLALPNLGTQFGYATDPVSLPPWQVQRLYSFPITVLDLLAYGSLSNGEGAVLHAEAIANEIPWGNGPSGLSNGWVIGPNASATTHSQILSDPHLGNEMPYGLRPYWVHMKSPSYEAAGWSAPGYPSVVLGVGRHVAWAATSIATNIDSTWVATTDAQRKTYPFGTSSQKVFRASDTIQVWDNSAGAVTPVPVSLAWADPEKRLPVLREEGITGGASRIYFSAISSAGAASIWPLFIHFGQAQTVQDAQAAFAPQSLIHQAFLFTDDTGGMYYRFNSRTAIRNLDSEVWLTQIMDGTDPNLRWMGFHTTVPEMLRPAPSPSTPGEVWIANNVNPDRVLPGGQLSNAPFPKYMVVRSFLGNLRQDRADELLRSPTTGPIGFNTTTGIDNLDVATDIRNNWGYTAWPYFKQAVQDQPGWTTYPAIQSTIARFDNWDFLATRDSEDQTLMALIQIYYDKYISDLIAVQGSTPDPSLPAISVDPRLFTAQEFLPALSDFHIQPNSPHYWEASAASWAVWQAALNTFPYLENFTLVPQTFQTPNTPQPWAGLPMQNVWGTASYATLTPSFSTMRDAVYPIPGSNSSLFISGGDFTAACGSAPTPFGPEIPICTIPVNIDLLRLPRTGGSRSLFVADMDPSGPKMFFLGLIGNSGYANGTARYGLAQRFADRDWIPMPLTSAEVAAASVSRFTLSY